MKSAVITPTTFTRSPDFKALVIGVPDGSNAWTGPGCGVPALFAQ